MNFKKDKEIAEIKRRLGIYNMVPNVIWSVVNLVPVSVFCYTRMSPGLLFVFIILSVVPAFFPNSFFDSIQAGSTTAVYKKLGVGLVKRFSQNGDIINRLLKRKFPHYKRISNNKKSIDSLLKQTYMYETFHFMMFLFFCLAALYAVFISYYVWALVISVTNLLYNVYPNLLQQYIRLKLKIFTKKQQANMPAGNAPVTKYKLKCRV